MKLIHLSDTHLVERGKLLYGLDPFARLRSAAASIRAEHPDAGFVAITGDLVQSGKEVEYRALSEALAELPMPVFLVPGNHDDRDALRSVFPRLPVDDQGYLQYAVDAPAGRFLFLDTLDAGRPGGTLCEHRLDWLGRELDRSGDQPAYLFMHHPPLSVGLPAMDCMGLSNPDDFWRILDTRGRDVRHVFFGHLHRPLHGRVGRVGFSCIPSTHHQVRFDTKAHACGGVVGCFEEPAYAVIGIEDRLTLVHLHRYLDASPRFLLGDPVAVGTQSTIDLEGMTPLSQETANR